MKNTRLRITGRWPGYKFSSSRYLLRTNWEKWFSLIPTLTLDFCSSKQSVQGFPVGLIGGRCNINRGGKLFVILTVAVSGGGFCNAEAANKGGRPLRFRILIPRESFYEALDTCFCRHPRDLLSLTGWVEIWRSHRITVAEVSGTPGFNKTSMEPAEGLGSEVPLYIDPLVSVHFYNRESTRSLLPSCRELTTTIFCRGWNPPLFASTVSSNCKLTLFFSFDLKFLLPFFLPEKIFEYRP